MDIPTQALRIDADNWQSDNTPPPGKPFAECSQADHERLQEIEADLALLIGEWRSVCNDAWPAVPLYRPLELYRPHEELLRR